MARKSPSGKAAKGKIHRVLSEFKHDTLHSGSKKGPVVKKKSQALAIAMSEGRKASKKKR